MSRVRLINISKHYGSTLAVENVNLDVAEGEFVTLLGPSGCGKTTTLRMIAGLIDPSTGRIYFDEQDVTYVAPNARNIGFAVNIVLIIKALERIGDHARNLAEYVIYQLRGMDIRHQLERDTVG